MRKRIAFLIVSLLLAALVCACSGAPADVVAPVGEENVPVMEQQVSIGAGATDAPAEPPAETVDDEVDEQLADKGDTEQTVTNVSLTTGLPVPEGTVYHPICVMVANTKAARPQINLMLADIIYMVPVESQITRMMCIFNDTLPEIVGPVRSLRLQFLNIQREWDAPLVHVGGPGASTDSKIAVFGSNAAHLKIRFNLKKAGSEGLYFYEGEGDNNVRVNLKKCDEKYDYFPEYRNQFRFDNGADLSAGEPWSQVRMSFLANKLEACYFRYKESDNRLYAYYDGEQFETKTIQGGSSDRVQFSCQNLIVQHTDIKTLSKELYGTAYRYATYTGTGDCDFFIGGKHFKGSWSRPTLDDATTYTLSDGTPLTLLPGNTFVAVHPLSGEVEIS